MHASECLKLMSGRFFDGRPIKAEFWDGKTDYRVVRESAEELNQRIDEFGRWLEGEQQDDNEEE